MCIFWYMYVICKHKDTLMSSVLLMAEKIGWAKRFIKAFSVANKGDWANVTAC